ncbi:hypothetical protein N7513_008692 [Penicillium frequentans]|nr:hypothetical protein N7513_008692 [Penicillium glabrum]
MDQDFLPEKSGVEEKVIDAPPSEVEHGIIKDWDKEESAVRRKIDFILIPTLALAFFSLQLDRGNISAVLTSTITEDLGITTNQVNIGTQLMSAGIVLSEIPSNFLLQRIGPRTWLSGQLFAWGLVATFQAFVQSYPAYLVTRILLGLCEGGFIPGALYYLSTWYKKDETSLRTSLFFYGQMFASATSSLISAGVLKLIEGVITLFIGIVFTLLVPPSVGDGRPLISFGRWSYFTERESQIMRNRVLLDDPKKARGHIQISKSDVGRALKNPRIMQHVLLTLVSMSAFQGLTQYTPTMIKSIGFGSVQANALASVPVYCSIIWLTILSFLADRLGHRGPFVLLAITWNVISYVCLRTDSYDSGKWHRYGVLAITNVSYCSMHILNVGWLSIYCRTPQERSVAMALVIMGANCAGISGSQIFRTEDAPKYLKGLTAICVLAGVSWVQAAVLGVQTYIGRKKATATDDESNPSTTSHS